MSDEKQETRDDIIAEMRNLGKLDEKSTDKIPRSLMGLGLRTLADRLEAAAKRDEKHAVEHATHHAEAVASANCRDCIYNPRGENYEGGNAAAMRDALEAYMEYSELVCKMGMFNRDRLVAITAKARAALSKPPRNCNVGTAQEQEKRFAKFCDAHKWVDDEGVNACSAYCPLYKITECALHWAQMPYEEGGAK